VDRKIRWPVAETVTSVPEAARYYYEGVDCVERSRGRGLDEACATPFELALAHDPSFALANYQLAVIRSPQGDPAEQARPHLAAALRAVDRLPPREASLVQALAARDEGRADAALRIYDAVLASAPDDVETLTAATDLQVARHHWAGALQYLEKLVAVSPDQESTVLDLVEVLGRLERRDALRDVLHRYSSVPITTFRAEIMAYAHWWLGESDGALEVARRAVSEQGDDALPLLGLALIAAGEYKEAEAVARRGLAAAPNDPWLRKKVARALAGQGRFREAFRIIDVVGRSTPRRDAMKHHMLRAMIAAGSADTSLVWQSTRLSAAIDPVFSSGLCVLLAFVGDVPHAQEVARAMPKDSEAAKQYDAMLLWRSGQAGEAMARLSSAETEDAWPVEGLAPAFLLAEVAAAAGEHRETLAAVARFRRVPPRGYWYPWASVRAMYLAARAHQALGDGAEARHEIDRALAQWAGADRDHPLLREMRSLRAKM
jgi:tetratricopeptide (TPR) repeat protein